MRSNEERIRLLHQRADGIRKKKASRLLFAAGGISAALFAILLSLTIYLQGLTGYKSGQFTASSLLSESVGGYVLVTVIAFMAGVVLTVLIMRVRKKKNKSREERNT